MGTNALGVVGQMQYVSAYDIVADGRCKIVAQFLEGWGRRVQKRVFECELSHNEKEKVYARIKEMLKSCEDRCHLYRICGECVPHQLTVGAAMEPGCKEVLVI